MLKAALIGNLGGDPESRTSPKACSSSAPDMARSNGPVPSLGLTWMSSTPSSGSISQAVRSM